MKNIITLIILLSFTNLVTAQQSYKDLIKDLSVNFYEVCRVAEAHFDTIDKTKKGSGWKPYQRWKNANEYKYYPSGDRSQTDPHFAANAYKEFLRLNPSTKSLYTNGWRELGPANIDSITGHYAAGLGRIEDFYVDPNNPNKMYLASRSGGFWKSLDGGQTWQGGSTDFMFASGVNTIAVDPANTNHVLINIQNSSDNNSHGVFESFDGGDTWSATNFNPAQVGYGGLGNNFKIFTIAYHPTTPNLIFIGTSKGIYRSANNLASWSNQYPSADITSIDFHPSDPNIVYLLDTYNPNGLRNYVYSSINAGINYTLSSQIVPNNNAFGKLSTSPDCPNCVYFASDNGVWKSTNSGQNFTFLSNPTESCDGFAVSDQDTSYMIYGYVDIMSSANGGNSFDQTSWWSLGSTEHGPGDFNQRYEGSNNYIHADLRVAKSINGVFYVGTDGLFAKSEDNGLTWTHLSSGLAIRENYKLGASQSNHYRSISGSQDNGTSIRHKDQWIEFYGADGMECLIHPLNDDWMLGSVQYGGRRRTRDGGQTQDGVSPASQSGSGNGGWEAPLAYDPNHQMRIYNFGTSVHASEDFGSSWTYKGAPSSFSGTIDQAAIAENNSSIIVISKGSAIDKSTNAGVSFASIKNNLPSYTIEDIAFHPKNDNIILVCYARYQNDNSKVYITYNGGASWTNITYNLGNMPVHSIVVDHSDDANIYLGAEIGVYTMPLNGTTWTLHNPNLPNTTIEELEIVYGSNTLKAATWGRGLWEYSLLDRLNYPAILLTSITDMPTESNPKENVDQWVTSEISYDGTLTSVYLEWSVDTAVFGNIIPMNLVQDSTWQSTQPLPNYPTGTDLYFKVFAIGNQQDTTETYKFMYTVQPFEYCPTSGTMTYQGNVTLVDFNEISKSSGKTSPYIDYTPTDSTAIYRTQDYDLTVNLNSDNGNYTYFAKAWIDWNQDADFDDSNEAYELGSTTNNTNAPTTLSPFSIQVPANADLGATTMRVACKYNEYPTLCDNGFDGEVEDYKLIILSEPNLNYTLSTSNICTDEDITFTYSGESVDSLQWTITGSGPTIENTNPTFTQGFSNSGNYDVVVEAFYDGLWFTSTTNLDFTVHGNTITEMNALSCNPAEIGVETVVLSSQYGCDSTVITTTSLTTEPNLNVNLTANTLMAAQTGASYQWLDCMNNFAPIAGETGISFTPTVDGQYAVEISWSTCLDTSACIQVTVASISELETSGILIFPNPTTNLVYINFEDLIPSFEIELLDMKGSLLFEKTEENTQGSSVDLSNFASGIYWLRLEINGSKQHFKIEKQ